LYLFPQPQSDSRSKKDRKCFMVWLRWLRYGLYTVLLVLVTDLRTNM
jgi:hypothetical protein